MLIAQNENQTYEQFKVGEAPRENQSWAGLVRPRVMYVLHVDGSHFMLVRIGETLVAGMKAPTFGAFPTAGAPHPHCPEHTYTPPAPVRCAPKMKKPVPSYLRAI